MKKQLIAALTMVLLTIVLPESLFAIGSLSATGKIGRGNTGYFDVTLTVPGVDITKLGSPTDLTALYTNHIYVYIGGTGGSSSDWIPAQAGTAVSFTIALNGTPTETASTTGTANLYDLTYPLRITETSSGALKTNIGTTGANLTFKYYETGAPPAQNPTVDAYTKLIPVSTAIASEAPSGFSATAGNQTATAFWTPPGQITYNNSTKDDPSGVSVLLLEKDGGPIDIPAMTYNSSSTATSDDTAAKGTCTYDPTFTDGNSCITCSSPTTNYINTSLLTGRESEGIYVKESAKPSAGSYMFSDLTNKKSYAVLLFFQPGGLNQTTCLTVTPVRDYSYAEINGESEASSANPRCFVATAAYGSPLHKNLKLFRWFREHVLLQTSAGRSFVHWYNIYGPQGAKVVSAHPALAFFVRGVLWVPALLISAWLGLTGQAPLSVSSGILVGILAAGIAMLVIRRRAART